MRYSTSNQVTKHAYKKPFLCASFIAFSRFDVQPSPSLEKLSKTQLSYCLKLGNIAKNKAHYRLTHIEDSEFDDFDAALDNIDFEKLTTVIHIAQEEQEQRAKQEIEKLKDGDDGCNGGACTI